MLNADRIEELYIEASRLPQADRESFLDRQSLEPDDRKRLCDLLSTHDRTPGFLETPNLIPPVMDPVTQTSLAEGPGTVIDRYKLLQLIGQGGFGAVYMAEQRVPVKRRVALKIIKLGMDTRQVIARFEAERQALAIMDHPNIARVLDAGATESGRPYFVMELVRGVPITEYCDSENLSVRQRLELFIEVCGAVQHAHQKGIIHRDIKPSNVMVTIADGRPIPKVIDFGIAKATDRELTDKTLFTEYRQVIGTPEYMSPEQAEMTGIDIDTRSDVFSLGVLLYELLTGATPLDARQLREAGYAEMQRIIKEDEPVKPSTRLSTQRDNLGELARRRCIEPAALPGLLRGDLDWIVMKALEKDRGRRYDTANGLAMDVQRHLADEPVTASPPGRVYRLSKFVRRNRAGVIAASLIALTLIIGASVASWLALHNQRIADELMVERDKARLLRDLMSGGQFSLAVLPLEYRSDDPEHAYLANGLTTTLVGELSRISALRVVSDESVRASLRIVGSRDLVAISRELHVHGVLTGWVERRGDRVVLTTRLTHALTNHSFLDRSYDAGVRNLEAMEHAVTLDLVDELDLQLTDRERQHLATAREIDPEAQEAVLKGHHLIHYDTRDDLLQALEYFDRAIAIEPDYAAAYAGRAKVFTAMENRYAAPLDSMPHAKAAALRAIELDDTLAEAHTAVGDVQLRFDWDWDGAAALYERAAELDPDPADGHVGLATVLVATGRADEALPLLERAYEIDPLIAGRNDGFMLGWFMSGRYEQAIRLGEQALEIDRNSWRLRIWLALAYAEIGQLDTALDLAEDARRIVSVAQALDPENTPPPIVFGVLGGIYAKLGRVRDAEETLERIDELALERFACPYETACVYIALGRRDEAFRFLRDAVDVVSPCIPWLGRDPRVDPVRDDDRFTQLIESDARIMELLHRNRMAPKPG